MRANQAGFLGIFLIVTSLTSCVVNADEPSSGGDGLERDACPAVFPVAGTWQGGYFDQSFQPIDRLEPVTLRLQAQGSDYSGSAMWGTADETERSPTDADVPPPGWQQESATWTQPLPGIEYRPAQVTACDNTLRLGIPLKSAYEEWCALQTSYDLASLGWFCIPGAYTADETTCSVESATGETLTFPSFKCEACRGVSPICECSEDGCTASSELTDFEFEYLPGPRGEVLVAASDLCENCTLRLERTR
jgi:hypothetical protein